MHNRDPMCCCLARRTNLDRCTIEEKPARISDFNIRKYAHQCRLAGAVFADDYIDLVVMEGTVTLPGAIVPGYRLTISRASKMTSVANAFILWPTQLGMDNYSHPPSSATIKVSG
jgi:hypothetical protein